MEFLAPVGSRVAAGVARQWRDGEGDANFAAVRREALAVDAEYRARVAWWDGIDLNEGNIRRALDGRLVFVDLFCFDGAALYGQILKDAAVVRRRIPDGERRHLLEIPYLARECSVDELEALRRAWGH